MKPSSTNSRILHIFMIIGLLFASLTLSLTWFELHGKTKIMTNTYNKRLMVKEIETIRGYIFDRDGLILAEDRDAKGIQNRYYPYKNLYTHVIGYDSRTYGKTLLEAKFNDALLGKGAYSIMASTRSLLTGDVIVGNSLHLTIDHDLQRKCREYLGNSKGVIIAMNPQTGEILAMVSTPDFDSNEGQLIKKWPELTESENSPFLPRGTMGLYPPGSIFKLVTAAAALENGLGDSRFNDEGSIMIDGKTFSNSGGQSHGEMNMTEAMTVSSNVFFVQLSELIGAKSLLSKADKLGIGRSFEFDLPLTTSRIGTADMGKTELAATAIGQGKLMVTPLQMTLLVSGIANGGTIMEPYLVKGISNSNRQYIAQFKPQKLYTFVDGETSAMLTNMMRQVVESGTGKKAQLSGKDVAGKTGTAQTEKSAQGEGYDHAWFVGFAPASDPKIAVTVLLEYQGKGGGQAAAPIARKVIADWLKIIESK